MKKAITVLGLAAVLIHIGACSSKTEHNDSPGDVGQSNAGAAGQTGTAGSHASSVGGAATGGGGAGGNLAKGGNNQGGAGRANGGAGAGGGGAGDTSHAGSAGTGVTNCSPEDVVPPDPGDNACNSFTPCGGDLTGKWTLGKNCADPAFHSYSVLCQGGTDVTELLGTLEFVVGGVYRSSAAFHTIGSVSQACVDGYQTTCGKNPFEDCVPNNNGCQCDHTGKLSEPEPGWTWTTKNNVLQTTDGCEIVTFYYCVNGNNLDIRSKSTTGQYFSAHATR